MSTWRHALWAIALLWWVPGVVVGATAAEATFILRLSDLVSQSTGRESPRLLSNSNWTALEFTTPFQQVELPLTNRLDDAEAVTIGGWFFPRRRGEQYFVRRGEPKTGAHGERFFRPAEDWVNFVLGTDERGFLLGTIDGNGLMPFPHVTVEEVSFDWWNQLVVVKSAKGVHKFYRNGKLVHSDEHSANLGKPRPFRDKAPGEPVWLSMPLGGLISEFWIYPRELAANEIRQDFETKRPQYGYPSAAKEARLREMNEHHAATLWPEPLTERSWPELRKRFEKAAQVILGHANIHQMPLDPVTHSEVDCGNYFRRKVSFAVQRNDRMPAYLLVPKPRRGRLPAVICFYGTTSGAGKDTTAGLSGRAPGSVPHRNSAFAIDLAEAGFVALAPDYSRDGERIKPGKRPYDTTDFYQEFPEWSIHGKDIWDTSRAIDYLQSLEFVDKDRIGMTGHSYGGHSTIFAAAMEPRIKVAVANGPVSDFLHHGLHWAVPKGGGNSQSMPALRPYLLDRNKALPLTFYQFTALIAPRPLLVGQAAGERRPMEEENYAAVAKVYTLLGARERVRYHWYVGDHDYPPEARAAAVDWFKKWFADPKVVNDPP